MGYEAMGRLHAGLVHLAARLRAGQDGQGTVEYIALVLLMGGVFAIVVKAAGGKDLGIGETISRQITGAIEKVVEQGGGRK